MRHRSWALVSCLVACGVPGARGAAPEPLLVIAAAGLKHALPALLDDRIVAVIDLKTDRQAKRVLIQQWTWIGRSKTAENRRRIEDELGRFERFQLGT